MKRSAPGTVLIFVGPLPPPIHGQSVATHALRDLLIKSDVRIRVIDNGPGLHGGLIRRLIREGKAHLLVILSPARTLYTSVNSNFGIFATILLCLIARLRRKRIMLHHHSYRYIGQSGALMAILARVSGPAATHIVNCPEMGRQLKAQYSTVKRTLSYSNVGVVDRRLRPVSRTQSELVLGHMSNLTQEKGLNRTIDAFREVRRCWPEAQLRLAGPCAEVSAEQTIANATAEFGAAFHYDGPVYGDDKQKFFSRIDVFVFPSLYAVETQGIVNLEALACGRPVVAFAQCCIPGDIGNDGGHAVPRDADFSQALIEYLHRYLQDRSGASRRARQQFETILQTHAVERAELLQDLGKRA
ncbi:MAG: glycosyltransferase family 4 protein [Planctomycetaceae bacterium]|nr:glycosyltransferase family 4 protein [Planctomycetaceae bacterium]